MDLHHLRHFVAVAEDLHFGRAALRLGMKQPPLSQSIQRLEGQLGLRLFDRSQRHVVLTLAGRALHDEARALLAQAEVAQRRVLLAARGERTRINLGYLPWSLVRSLPRAMRSFNGQWRGVKVKLHERTSTQQVAALRCGELDLGLVSVRNADTTGLRTRVVERSEMAVAIPSGWALARKARVSLEELADLPFILFSPQLSPASHAAFLLACKVAGFVPNVVHEISQPFTLLNMVVNEFGVALVQATAADMPLEGATIVPLVEGSTMLGFPVALAWDDKACTPSLRALIEHVAGAAAEPPTAPRSSIPLETTS